MILTITNTKPPAADMGYLFHKNPGACQSFSLSFGKAHVFYPEADDQRCTIALLLDVDPVGMIRGNRNKSWESFSLSQYVNDRPYVASSFLSVAIAHVFHSALMGTSRERPELAEETLPLEAKIAVLPSPKGEGVLRRLFEPLGYDVEIQRLPLDDKFPEWGPSDYYAVRLSGEVRLKELLAHLYVLIPVLDGEKHYWVEEAEVEKLIRHGEGWLSAHPEKEFITRRYLKYQRSLADDALKRLLSEETADPVVTDERRAQQEESLEDTLRLSDQRTTSILSTLMESGARRVIDMGCGEGKLLNVLLESRQFDEIVGMDVSHRSLERARRRLRFDQMAPLLKEKIKLIQGSLVYRDQRLSGYDAACLVEVIEHVDPSRLSSLERVVFEFAKPKIIIVTTPNVEYNATFAHLPAGKFRHPDHRFEWTRPEFQSWAQRTAERFGYTCVFKSIGPVDAVLGAPTQMAVFRL